MPKYRVTLDRTTCIGAAPCASAAPAFFSMEVAGDGKVDIVPSKNPIKEGQFQHLDIEASDLQACLDAAQVCPVLAISVTDLETGEKLFPK